MINERSQRRIENLALLPETVAPSSRRCVKLQQVVGALRLIAATGGVKPRVVDFFAFAIVVIICERTYGTTTVIQNRLMSSVYLQLLRGRRKVPNYRFRPDIRGPTSGPWE